MLFVLSLPLSLPSLSSKLFCASVAARKASTAAFKFPLFCAYSAISRRESIISSLFEMVLISVSATLTFSLFSK